MLQVVMGNPATVLIPNIQTLFLPKLPAKRVVLMLIIQGIKHHVFVVAKEHFHIWHRHELSEDLNPVRIPVNHISQDIERVLRLKIDLFHNGFEAALLPVNIGKYIYHGLTASFTARTISISATKWTVNYADSNAALRVWVLLLRFRIAHEQGPEQRRMLSYRFRIGVVYMSAKFLVELQELSIIAEVREAIHNPLNFLLIRKLIVHHSLHQYGILLECCPSQ